MTRQIPRNHCHPLLVARVRGTEAEMGHQLGTMVREAGQFRESLEYYQTMVERVLAGSSRMGRLVVRRMAERGMRKLEARQLPAARARSRAFMEALGVPADWARYYQLFDTMQNIVSFAGRLGLGALKDLPQRAPAMCSTLVAWGQATSDGELCHLRNFDLPGVGIYEKTPSVVFCTPKEGQRYGYASVRAADLATINGFNEAGISVTTHNRFHRQTTFRGTPLSDVVHQILLHAETLADAVRIAEGLQPIASSYGVAISSARENQAISLETHSGMVRAVDPKNGLDALAVTNHYIHPDMIPGELAVSPGRVLNTEARTDFLEARAAEGGLSLSELQGLLASFEDAESAGGTRSCGGVPAQIHSVQSVAIQAAAKRIHVTVGPVPSGGGPWATVDWDWDSEPGYEIREFEPDSLPITMDPNWSDGARAAGLESFIQAAAHGWTTLNEAASRQHMEEAVQHLPEEAAFRLLLGGLMLREGKNQEALAQFEAGILHEKHEFYRGGLLLWASRTASALGQGEKAQKFRQELQELGHPLLEKAKIEARSEEKKPFRASKLKKVRPNYPFCELQTV